MKKYNILLIPMVAISAVLGTLLSNLDNVEAENNEVCGSTYFRDNVIKKIEVEDNNNNITVTNKSGLDLNYEFFADGSESVTQSGNFAKDEKVTVTVESEGLFSFILNEEIKTPCVSEANHEIGTMQVSISGIIDNPLYNKKICTDYRNKWNDNEIMKNAVPYCFLKKTYEEYDEATISSWIKTAEELYNTMNTSNQTDLPPLTEGYEEVNSTTGTLVCDAFSNNNYDTPHKYSYEETKNIDNCETTCREEIEVNFSDPVATQAGMCFQYLIEIKSKVNCSSRYTGPVPSRKPVCNPSPICINGKKGFDAGGPNEDFDQCIQECDKGEYTQKCIDKCYKKIYDNKAKTKKTTTKEDIKISSGLYNYQEEFYEIIKLENSCPGPNNAQKLYEYMQNNPSGQFVNGSWDSDFDNTNSINTNSICSLGPYYFRSLSQTQKTINMWKGQQSYSNRNKYYRAGSDGILKAVHKDGTWCNDSCSWRGVCNSENTALTEALAQKEYEEQLQEYAAAKAACENKSLTCTNEQTNYKIIVDNKDSDKDDNDDKKEFTSSQILNDNKVTGDFPSMVTLIDGTCEDKDPDDWDYHNIITFPGGWINNKTGQTIHSIEPGFEEFYTYTGNQYCTKFNSIPVNTSWYNWKVNSIQLNEEQKENITKEIDYNINGEIENYGYFGWNFNIKCFYAIDDPKDPNCTINGKNPDYPICHDDGKEKIHPINDYKFRPVDLNNLFPTKENKEERSIGFNWTCEATNLSNKDYLVQPETLRKEIETLGDDVYNGNEYLDYQIVLTPKTINKIRNYNKNYKIYTEPTSNDKEKVSVAGNNKTAGVTVYKSKFLDDVLDSEQELVKRGLIGCNNEDKGSCKTAIDTTTRCYNEYSASSLVKGVR